ncbi:MAG: hypothetical protein VKO21_11920 [Candidatus Sericytochromatia bacterium]|nr:hypothetical protein [Candidatus Sericytochromatia bacterium]
MRLNGGLRAGPLDPVVAAKGQAKKAAGAEAQGDSSAGNPVAGPLADGQGEQAKPSSGSELKRNKDGWVRGDRNGDDMVSDIEKRLSEAVRPAKKEFSKLDKNKDDKLTGDELPDHLKDRDENGDGIVTRGEMRRKAREGISFQDLFKGFDQNGDGVLEAGEAKRFKRFRKMDADGDGKVSEAEFVAFREMRAAIRQFKDYDQDGDKVLTAGELPADQLAAADGDQDGKVTREEWLAFRQSPAPVQQELPAEPEAIPEEVAPPPAPVEAPAVEGGAESATTVPDANTTEEFGVPAF